MFYLVNPTDSLLLTKRKIENAEQVITSIDEVTVNEQNTTVSNDILTILGGFANREELDAALDLYFLYYQKRPDLLQQFYNTAITEYGITLDDQIYDYNTLNRFIQKLIENAENWKNKNVCKLFVYSAKHFLQFSFHSVGNKGKNGFMFYTIEIRATNGTAEYRKKIWESLIDLYSKEIEMQQIESILYNYGNGSSKSCEEVVRNDYPFIIELLKLFTNKESYFFCKICDNLKRIFTLMDIPQDEDFTSILESNPFQLYKTFERKLDYKLTFKDAEEVAKKEIEQYISKLNKEEFIGIIDFFCDAEIGFSIIQSINYAFEFIFENKDYYLDALEHYFYKYEHKQSPLSPDIQIALMYNKYTDEEIWSIISEAPPEIKNTWQFYFFANMPQKYIDYNHLQKWYEYLNDDSDKSIQSSGYRKLFFLSQYKSIDPDVIRKSLQTVLAKQEYSVFIVQIYTTLFSNSLTEMISATMDFFTDSYDLLSELYVLSVTTKRHEDYHGELLKEIYVRYPSVLDLLIEHWNTNDSYLSHDDTLRLSKLFEVENYEELFDHIMDMTAQSHRSYELSSMLSSTNINEKYKDRPDKWLNYFIVKNANDDRKMQMISEAISGMNEDKRIDYLKLFLSNNTAIESFKNWNLLPGLLSYSGSELPLIQKQIDYLTRVLSLLNGLTFLEHKKYIEDEIESKKRYMEHIEIEEILRGIEQ